MKFRTDINGLRAIAIIGVVLFHFNFILVPGGFAGVDVFFVISGFLMTSIIFRGIEENSFSIFKFYIQRTNRIIPPLAVLTLVLLILGWLYLSPTDYKALSKHVLGSLGFVSNIIYWREVSYFDAAAYEKWLLHTWSLSVEWQFYILYPIILVFLKNFFSFNNIKWFILFGTIISFSISVYAVNKWPIPAYYLLPSRGWEMLLGSLAYLFPITTTTTEKNKKLLELFGFSLIVLSFTLITKENLWPGYLAFIPVFGTYLIIISNRQKSILTNNLIFQKLGKWSYSIYLWHWPILVYSYYFPKDNWYIIGIPLSILLGWLSFKFIESYKFPSVKNLQQLISLKATMFFIVLLIVSAAVYLSNGATLRYPDKDNLLIEELSSEVIMPRRENGYCFYSFDNKTLNVDSSEGQECFLGKTSDIKDVDTLLFGDSFAGTYDPFWNKIFMKINKTYQSVSTNWCTPSFTENFTGRKSDLSYKQCLLNRTFLKESISKKKYKNIIFASSWNSVLQQGYMDDFLHVVDEASKQGINVFVMATPTSYIRDPIPLFIRSVYEDEPFILNKYERSYKSNNYVNDFLSKKLKTYPNVYFIDRKMMFENTSTFEYKGSSVPYSLDGNHMSLIGSIHAADYFSTTAEYITIIENME
ncbi:acyltransferase [bacterium]|nr:acyltransferase [bacterium]